ncbi:MAG: hypothetical protein H6867_06510 [Rhodospirillales bacterium]|nr:hypothetical protein [Rhodospirillales bacterium]MCB9995201.1 hypothetical protein [Rhodospirillales bacterium]
MKSLFYSLNILIFMLMPLAPSAQARPVSYPGGWTAMTMNDVDSNALHIHYSPNARNSLGWRHEYLRDPKAHMDALQWNTLLKRWNQPGAQANFYIKSGAGIAYDDGETEAAAFTGVAADWETRRWFTSYENRFFYAGDIARFARHKARAGVAPYIGDYGDLHTWLMLQADYDAGERDDFSLTPMVRFFKGPSMLEAGINLDGGGMLNFIQRF